MRTSGTASAPASAIHTGSVLSVILIVSGTCIGAGMLALPLVTGLAGFWPAMAVNALCWIFMLATGLLFLETTLWMEDGANVLSMAERFFGYAGKLVGGGTFLFLYYCLMIAYLAGGTPLLTNFLESLTGVSLLTHTTGTIVYALFFGLVVFLGTFAIDRVNGILMGGLVIAYCLMLGIGASEVQAQLLTRANWGLSLLALPTLFSAYGYHNVIPSLCTYVKRNERVMRYGIILGITIPFICYGLWQWLVIGAVPESELIDASKAGTPVSRLLLDLENPWIGKAALFFSFFAIVTSLLGVAMSMVDFLGDGLGIKRREGLKRLALCLAVFVPPGIFAAQNPHVFLDALAYAGGFGEAILNGLLPVGMVWVGRYKMGLPSAYKLPGGRLSLVTLLLLTLIVMVLEVRHAFGWQ